MKEVSKLLERFRKVLDSGRSDMISVSRSVYDVTGLKVKEKDISIRNGNVYIKCDSVIKNEIILNEAKIISLFHKKGGSSSVVKIR